MEDTGIFGCIGGGIVFIAFIVIVLLVGGVFRTEVSFSPTAAKASGGRSFEENLTARHWLGGLIKGKQPDFQLALGKYLRAGEQVSHISIVTRHSFVDSLLTGITLSIYCPMTVTIRGKISKVGTNPR